jgi:hypothetical protein
MAEARIFTENTFGWIKHMLDPVSTRNFRGSLSIDNWITGAPPTVLIGATNALTAFSFSVGWELLLGLPAPKSFPTAFAAVGCHAIFRGLIPS